MTTAITRVAILAGAMALGSAAQSQNIQPDFFPDVRDLDYAWTLSVPENRKDGFQYNTRIAFQPVGPAPVTAWVIEVECEKTDTKTRHFELVSAKGTARIRNGLVEMTAGKIGRGTMQIKEPMTIRFGEIKCGSGSPWIAPAEQPQSRP
ncbi:hypothetical protein [Bosea sp. RAC05]|uniref:hypothetical protein n=1 Tax=Bosea sp. RAC05 TaxID=1842539 RepID=UPI00083CB457|nr:hypothetical protein [Bosea sp. RAC05]AOG03230.1 hypothetical protein BSY19_5177 [Bosea sp. RAC05]